MPLAEDDGSDSICLSIKIKKKDMKLPSDVRTRGFTLARLGILKVRASSLISLER